MKRAILIPSLIGAVSLLGACVSNTTTGADPAARTAEADLSVRQEPAQAPAAAITAAATTGDSDDGTRDTLPPPEQEIEYGHFPPDILNRVILAEIAGQRGMNRTALDEYLALARETGDVNIIRRAARIAVFMRDISAAVEITELWLEREPDSRDAVQTQALQLLSMGRFEDSLEYFGRLYDLGGDVDFRLVSSRVGDANLDDADMRELITRFENLQQQYPEERTLRLALADLYQQNSQLETAHDLIAPLTEDLASADIETLIFDITLLDDMGETRRAERKLRQALEVHADSKRLRFQYGRRLVGEQRFDEAMEQFEIIVEQYPEDFSMLYSLALITLEADRSEQGKAYLRRLIEHGEFENSAHYYMGLVLSQEGNTDGAIEHYRQVNGGDNFMAAQQNLTELMVREGRYPEASTRLDDLRARRPDSSMELLTMEANVLLDAGMNRDARTLLSEALDSSPNNSQLLYLRSVASQNLDDLAMMERDLRKVIQLNPTNPTAYNSLGYTLADRTERYQEAYELIQRAIELAPNDPAIIDSLGWVQYQLGMYDQAEANLREAYRQFPHPEVAAHLGEVLWVSGDRQEAREIWEQALEEEPESEYILNTMERLETDQ